METGNRERLLVIKQSFEQCEKSNQSISMEQLLNKLEISCGKSFERKAIYKDIKLLNEYLGLGISYDHHLRTYKVSSSKRWTKAEYEIIRNALISSRAITEEETKIMINKLKDMAGTDSIKTPFGTSVISDNAIKNQKSDVNENLKIIREAIEKNRMIRFDYGKYDETLTFVPIITECIVSPFETSSYHEFQYMLGNFEGRKLSNYRIDRMMNLEVLKKGRRSLSEILGTASKIDLAEFFSKQIGRSSGTFEYVKIRFHNDVINDVIDSFGEKIHLEKDIDGHFVLYERLYLNKKLVSWVLSFGGMAEVLLPAELRESLKVTAKQLVQCYEHE